MPEEILACLDGSSLAEKILPLAQGIAALKNATLTVFRVVEDADQLSSEEAYLRERARRFGAQIGFAVSRDPGSAILEELKKVPRAIAVMTTHGRSSWSEALLGSVALQVLRGAMRPMILYRPPVEHNDAPARISTLVLALDGGDFSEKIIPFAAPMAKSLKARLFLVHALPLDQPVLPALRPQERSDVSEASYLRHKAGEIKKIYAMDCDWEVLHGQPADAICRYVKGMPETMLAMTTHARSALKRAVLGSVAGACLRRAGVPMLIYWPPP
jgi:nucleotide-binding universal stress UspA family protein